MTSTVPWLIYFMTYTVRWLIYFMTYAVYWLIYWYKLYQSETQLSLSFRLICLILYIDWYSSWPILYIDWYILWLILHIDWYTDIKYINLKLNESWVLDWYIFMTYTLYWLIYFMTYTVWFPGINTFVTWRWPWTGAETCRQFKITTSKNLVVFWLSKNPLLIVL